MNKNQLKQHLQLSTYMEIDSVKYLELYEKYKNTEGFTFWSAYTNNFNARGWKDKLIQTLETVKNKGRIVTIEKYYMK